MPTANLGGGWREGAAMQAGRMPRSAQYTCTQAWNTIQALSRSISTLLLVPSPGDSNNLSNAKPVGSHYL